MRILAILLATTLPALTPAGAQSSAPIPTQSPDPTPQDPAQGLQTPRHWGNKAAHLAQALDLSLEQQTKMSAIREKHSVAMKADREASRARFEAFHAVLENPKASDAQLRQAFDQLNANRFQSLLDRRAMRLEMRAVLTPEQQAKADAMKAAFKERMKARMEERRAAWAERQPLKNN